MKHKILYFSDCHIYGGSERNIINLSNNIAEQTDLEVFFAYRYFKAYQLGVDRDLSKKVNAIPLSLLSNLTIFQQLRQRISNRLLISIIKLPLWLIQKIGIYALYDYLVLRNAISQIKPDLIHVNNGGYPSSFLCQVVVFAAKHSGVKKIIYHINNPAERRTKLLDNLIDKKINQYTNYFITASRMANVSLAENRFFDVHKLVQIFNTVEHPTIFMSKDEICKLHNTNPNKFIISEVAFLSQRKGQQYILNALRRIKDNYPDIYSKLLLFLVGDGEDFHKLKNYCKLNHLDNVIFTGYRYNYADYIACSDIFILPSLGYEDMPLVVLTAMQLGKPIIATEVAGIVEEIENFRSGILLKIENLDSLHLEIVKLFRDCELREYYGKNALKRFNKYFAHEQVYGEIKTLYAKLLASDSPCPTY